MAGGTRSQDELLRHQQEVHDQQQQIDALRQEVRAHDALLTQQILETRNQGSSQIEELRMEMRALIGELTQTITTNNRQMEKEPPPLCWQRRHATAPTTPLRHSADKTAAPQRRRAANAAATSWNKMVDEKISPQPAKHVGLSCPRFSDGNPVEWLYKLQLYFSNNNIQPSSFMIYAALHLDRPASSWYIGMLRTHPSLTFPLFVEAIIKQYGHPTFEDPVGPLIQRQQELVSSPKIDPPTDTPLDAIGIQENQDKDLEDNQHNTKRSDKLSLPFENKEQQESPSMDLEEHLPTINLTPRTIEDIHDTVLEHAMEVTPNINKMFPSNPLRSSSSDEELATTKFKFVTAIATSESVSDEELATTKFKFATAIAASEAAINKQGISIIVIFDPGGISFLYLVFKACIATSLRRSNDEDVVFEGVGNVTT